MSEGFNFEIGQLVHHRRYGYRGVVFDRDAECRADEEWYFKNQTQPPRDQPWYHVLVHGATHSTYVAESNLEPDATHERIDHPMIEDVFQSFIEGQYHVDNLN